MATNCLNVLTNAGTKIYIAPAANMPVDNTKALWEAVTGWLEISTATSLSAYGLDREVIRYTTLAGSVCKQAGASDNGAFEFRCADLPEDAGQLLAYGAASETQPYPVKVVYADTTATYDVATTVYAAGFVRSWQQVEASDANSIREVRGVVELGDFFLKVPRYDATP